MATNRLNLDPPPSLDCAIDIAHPKIEANGDIDYGGMTFLRNKNPNGIAPRSSARGVSSTTASAALVAQRQHYTAFRSLLGRHP